MIWVSRFLRLGLTGFCIYVLSGIIAISFDHFNTGNACPMLGPIPACYVVSLAYTAMGVASLLWNKDLTWLFVLGLLPIVLLALTGTTMELLGHPTCPRSERGVPLCYVSLTVGLMMAAVFFLIRKIEKSQHMRSYNQEPKV